jgi:2,3-dihydroxy-2,3-dihydrophenylpropionate dehydrogenase
MTMAATPGRDGPRAVLVTGGGSGIGLAVVREFVQLGDSVTVLDRLHRPPELAEEVAWVVGDVSDPEANGRAVATALERNGRLDVFVGNAGIHDGGFGIHDLSPAELADIVRRVVEIDVIGYLLGARAAAKPLIASRGCMIFTLSDAAFVAQGVGAGVGYTIAKHAALGLVRHLAAELAPEVRVNGVAPGGAITGLQAVVPGKGTRPLFDNPDAVCAAIEGLNPLQVVLTPEQIAALYPVLASPAAMGMTGEVLRPDGGLALR